MTSFAHQQGEKSFAFRFKRGPTTFHDSLPVSAHSIWIWNSARRKSSVTSHTEWTGGRGECDPTWLLRVYIASDDKVLHDFAVFTGPCDWNLIQSKPPDDLGLSNVLIFTRKKSVFSWSWRAAFREEAAGSLCRKTPLRNNSDNGLMEGVLLINWWIGVFHGSKLWNACITAAGYPGITWK